MFIFIDKNKKKPYYQQIIYQIKEQIRNGSLKPGDDLPSVRELADSLNINLHTVHKAYQNLREQNILAFKLGMRAKITNVKLDQQNKEVDENIIDRLREIVNDSYHLGISKSELIETMESIFDDSGEDYEHNK